MPSFETFPPASALVGGALIGIAASALLALSGRVAGVSGIVGGLLGPRRGEWEWRAAFAVGLLAGGGALLALAPAAVTAPTRGLGALAVAGLLVGFGARMGSGCTSGHGVCGVSRLSLRSLAATITFVATGVLAATLARLAWGGGRLTAAALDGDDARVRPASAARRLAVAFGSGLLFAIGLGVSGMTRPSKVIGFLDMFGGRWDPSLLFVMGGAIAVHLPFFRWLRRRPGFTPPASTCAPDAGDENDASSSSSLTRVADRRLLAGAALFGLGWGLGGYCPGPAVASLASAAPGVLVFVAAMLVGMLAFAKVGTRRA